MRKIVFIIALILMLAPIKIISMDTESSSDISGTGVRYSDDVSPAPVRNGGPLQSAFSDNFDTGSLDGTKWTGVGVVVNGDGKNEPSGAFSANLDGAADTLTSVNINLLNYGYGFLNSRVQPEGNSDEPEVGDDLKIEMKLTYGWRVVQLMSVSRVTGDLYFPLEIPLPKSAFHTTFQIRFSTTNGENNLDDWFIDDVNVTVSTGMNLFFDDFESGWAKWPVRTGSPDINGFANGIPSPTNALNLDGSGDLIESGAIDLSQESEGYVYYFVEQGWETGGNRDEPEMFDDLSVQYYTATSTWNFLWGEWGGDSGFDQFTLQMFPILLPPDAFHNQFKIRINTSQREGANKDDWFVDNVGIITTSVPNSMVVFNDEFDSTSLDGVLWPVGNRQGTPQANGDAQNEPSASYSLNLDGSGDMVATKFIDLTGAKWASLTYWYQQRGGGDEPEAGDDLKVELKFRTGWKEVTKHVGGHGSNTFVMQEIPIPQDAYYNQLQARFSTPVGDGANKDDWFIDNIKVHKGLIPNQISLFEPFGSTSLDNQWQILTGDPEINDKAHNEPSPLYSLDFDGEADMAASPGVNLSNLMSATVSFQWQQGDGSGNDEPEANDDMYADILLPSGWLNIFYEKGSKAGTSNFKNFTFVLPQIALHNNFKVRFRVTSTEGQGKDDWFIDNVSISAQMLLGHGNIGVYYEYSDRETEGINPLKTINEVFTDYRLRLFDNYMYAAENLSQLSVFIISEQKYLGQQNAQNIHLFWKNTMTGFLNGGGKVIVMDGGEGNSRLLVESFVNSSGNEGTFGSVDKAMHQHPLCQNLQNSFNSPTNTAYFTGVNGRILLTLTVNHNPEAIVVEKRCGQGSVMLFGFDYSEWNLDTQTLLINAITWMIQNEIDISKPIIEHSDVYAGSVADTITIDVFDTIGPEDVSLITLDINNTGISVVYENDAPTIQGDSNNTLSIDSWYTEATVENLKLHLNLTFNWNFPIIGDIDVNVSAEGVYLPEVYNVTPAFIDLMNKVSFLGEITVKNELDQEISPGEFVGAGEEITFSGITVVYNGTVDEYPPDDQFDMELWGKDGSCWKDTNSSGREISIAATVPNNATGNYTFELKIGGAAGPYSDQNLTFYTSIDESSPLLSNPSPDSSWETDPNVNCTIDVVDQGGAGLIAEEIKCQYSTDNEVTWSQWLSADSFEGGTAVKTITFEEGKDNYVKWQASDRVGNGPIESDSINIWVDSEPVEFYDLLPADVENSLTPTCSVCVRDAASGVDVSRISARQSTDAGSTWTTWTEPKFSEIEGGYKLTYVASFVEGDENRIEWRVKDIVGNENITNPHTVSINTSLIIAPEVELISPADSAIEGLKPTLIWELSRGNATGVNYRLFLDKTDAIDTTSNASLISSSGASSYTFDDDLENGTTYYWTVIPVRTEDGNDTVGLCSDGVWSFTVEEGFETLEVKLNTPADLATTNETPTLKWNLRNDPEEVVTYKLFVGKSSSIDIASDTDLVAALSDTFYKFDEKLDNETTYFWTVIPFTGDGNNTTQGICIDSIWSFTVEEGFISIYNFSIAVDLEQGKTEFYGGEKINLTIILNNTGNNPDEYTITIDKNYSVVNMGLFSILKKTGKSIKSSIELPAILEPGTLTINLTVTSGGAGTKIEKIVITILEREVEDPSDNTSDTDQGFFSDIPILWIVIGIAALLLIIIIIIIIRRRGDDEWDDDDEYDDYDDDDYDDDDDDDEEEDGVFSRIKKGDSPADEGNLVPCNGCGKSISAGTVFCIHCGVKQTGEEPLASKPATAMLTEKAAPAEQDDDDIGGGISLDELMSRASQLIESEFEKRKEATGEQEKPQATAPEVTLPEQTSGVAQTKALPPSTAAKEMSLDDVTSVDDLLNVVVVESAPLEDDDEDVIEVVASSPLEEDEALPMPTVSVALLDDDEDEEEMLPPPSLSLEDVMMEVVGAPTDLVEEDDMEVGGAPPPPPPE